MIDLSGVEAQAKASTLLEFIEVTKSMGKMKMLIVKYVSMWRLCKRTMRKMLVN